MNARGSDGTGSSDRRKPCRQFSRIAPLFGNTLLLQLQDKTSRGRGKKKDAAVGWWGEPHATGNHRRAEHFLHLPRGWALPLEPGSRNPQNREQVPPTSRQNLKVSVEGACGCVHAALAPGGGQGGGRPRAPGLPQRASRPARAPPAPAPGPAPAPAGPETRFAGRNRPRALARDASGLGACADKRAPDGRRDLAPPAPAPTRRHGGAQEGPPRAERGRLGEGPRRGESPRARPKPRRLGD